MLQAYLLKNPTKEKLEAIIEDFKQRNEKFKENNPDGFEKALKKFIQKQKLAIAKASNLDNIKEILPLGVNSQLGQNYIKDQNFALQFTLENRKRMIATIHTIMNEVIGKELDVEFEFKEKDEIRFINRNHNHAYYNEERGEWIHRKGATHAEEGMRGVIPANMRDGSFVVIGKGNVDSLASSSHGSGRVMSRKKAKKNISLEDFEASVVGIRGTVDENTLDESPFAYKDIFEVMRLQEELVEEHIKVLINVKDNSKSRY
jgi:tRNA-splicing ligase RtcB